MPLQRFLSSILNFSGNKNQPSTRRPLALSPKAAVIHSRIETEIKKLLQSDARSALEPEFINGYEKIMELFEEFQKEVIAFSGNSITCSNNCTRCCFHWVEDVYSFEAEIIADYIKKNFSSRVSEILDRFRKDVAEIERLDAIVGEKMFACGEDKEASGIDSVDLLLSGFYQLRRPCALLDDNGACGIYPVRPLTCRIYLSFSDPMYCDPDYINESDVRTYLLDLEESASELLDQLHMEFDRFENDMGLRSVLIKCLES
jgi:Fe-S-cluster containining protein